MLRNELLAVQALMELGEGLDALVAKAEIPLASVAIVLASEEDKPTVARSGRKPNGAVAFLQVRGRGA
jgi:hypothetical protein